MLGEERVKSWTSLELWGGREEFVSLRLQDNDGSGTRPHSRQDCLATCRPVHCLNVHLGQDGKMKFVDHRPASQHGHI